MGLDHGTELFRVTQIVPACNRRTDISRCRVFAYKIFVWLPQWEMSMQSANEDVTTTVVGLARSRRMFKKGWKLVEEGY